jgi:hypothetical protein
MSTYYERLINYWKKILTVPGGGGGSNNKT